MADEEPTAEVGRDVPTGVMLTLRTEVGFGCPVSRCRMPFLSWHHFDPPWNERKHHDPEGMIALCLHHHHMADRGVWSKGQLREMKRSAVNLMPVIGKFEWARPAHLLRIGSNYVVDFAIALKLGGEEVVRFSEEKPGILGVSFRFRDAAGKIAAEMQGNVFRTNPSALHDLQVGAAGKTIRIRSAKRDLDLDLRSERRTIEELRHIITNDDINPSSTERILEWVRRHAIDDEGRASLLEINRAVLHGLGGREVRVDKHGIQSNLGANLKRCVAMHGAEGATAFAL